MWPQRSTDQAKPCPIFPLERPENDSHETPKSGRKRSNLDEFEHGKPSAPARQLAPAAPRDSGWPALAGGDRPVDRRAVRRLGPRLPAAAGRLPVADRAVGCGLPGADPPLWRRRSAVRLGLDHPARLRPDPTRWPPVADGRPRKSLLSPALGVRFGFCFFVVVVF